MKNWGTKKIIGSLFFVALVFLNSINRAMAKEGSGESLDVSAFAVEPISEEGQLLQFAGTLRPLTDPNPTESGFVATKLFSFSTKAEGQQSRYMQAGSRSIQEFMQYFVRDQPLGLQETTYSVTFRHLGDVTSRSTTTGIYRVESIRIARSARARFILNADRRTLLATFGGRAQGNGRKTFRINNHSAEEFRRQIASFTQLPAVIDASIRSPQNLGTGEELLLSEISAAAPVEENRGKIVLANAGVGHCSDDSFDVDAKTAFGVLVPLNAAIGQSAVQMATNGKAAIVKSVCGWPQINAARCGTICRVAVDVQ